MVNRVTLHLILGTVTSHLCESSCLYPRGSVSISFVKSLLMVSFFVFLLNQRSAGHLHFYVWKDQKYEENSELLKGTWKTGLWQFNKVSKDYENKQPALMLSITELLQGINQFLFSQKKHRLRLGLAFIFSFRKSFWFTVSTSKNTQIDKLHWDSICSLWGERLLTAHIFITCYKRNEIFTWWHWTPLSQPTRYYKRSHRVCFCVFHRIYTYFLGFYLIWEFKLIECVVGTTHTLRLKTSMPFFLSF